MAPIDTTDVPDGTVAEIIEWVNEDPDQVDERAEAALAAEEAKGDDARVTLVAALSAQLGLDAPPDEGDADDELADEVVETGDVWFELGNGVQWHVTVGSPAYERLVAENARRIDDPTA